MNRMLVRQMIRENLYIAIGYFVLLTIALLAAVLYWPELRDNVPVLIKLVPFDKLKGWVQQMEQEGYWPYFVVQQFFKGCSLFGLAAAALIGSGMVAREADQNTAEFLLSRPVSRRRVLLVRWAVGVVMLAVPVFLSSIAGWAVSVAIDEKVSFVATMICAAYLSLFLMTLFSFTAWMSAGATHQLRPGVTLVGITLLMFALYLVKVANKLSIFMMVDHEVLVPIRDGIYPWGRAAIFVIASGVLLYGALRRFEARDF
ncbi:MAG TPA: ABC transporter permease subunit [Planctomycetota bacterium]